MSIVKGIAVTYASASNTALSKFKGRLNMPNVITNLPVRSLLSTNCK